MSTETACSGGSRVSLRTGRQPGWKWKFRNKNITVCVYSWLFWKRWRPVRDLSAEICVDLINKWTHEKDNFGWEFIASLFENQEKYLWKLVCDPTSLGVWNKINYQQIILLLDIYFSLKIIWTSNVVSNCHLCRPPEMSHEILSFEISLKMFRGMSLQMLLQIPFNYHFSCHLKYYSKCHLKYHLKCLFECHLKYHSKKCLKCSSSYHLKSDLKYHSHNSAMQVIQMIDNINKARVCTQPFTQSSRLYAINQSRAHIIDPIANAFHKHFFPREFEGWRQNESHVV